MQQMEGAPAAGDRFLQDQTPPVLDARTPILDKPDVLQATTLEMFRRHGADRFRIARDPERAEFLAVNTQNDGRHLERTDVRDSFQVAA